MTDPGAELRLEVALTARDAVCFALEQAGFPVVGSRPCATRARPPWKKGGSKSAFNPISALP